MQSRIKPAEINKNKKFKHAEAQRRNKRELKSKE